MRRPAPCLDSAPAIRPSDQRCLRRDVASAAAAVLLADEPGTGKTIMAGCTPRDAEARTGTARSSSVRRAWRPSGSPISRRFLGGGLRLTANDNAQDAVAGHDMWVVSLELAAVNPAVQDAIRPTRLAGTWSSSTRPTGSPRPPRASIRSGDCSRQQALGRSRGGLTTKLHRGLRRPGPESGHPAHPGAGRRHQRAGRVGRPGAGGPARRPWSAPDATRSSYRGQGLFQPGQPGRAACSPYPAHDPGA